MGDDVDDHAQPELVRPREQSVEISEITEDRV
ncbi:hypothetical protein FB565_003473 [Actinoplanes lutulentus]|uniref:Uncharacterized protein n=1 Tax=Actinoplanes lutulentus TaxID=1287878 RepID=A0A327Z5M7_9ACTN|nr:hypothetical protein [Actinoplanes lutulentus]RAK29286.1 hypothetical protein B0I29_11878 [Actinoplanes lutulentus]